MGFLGLKFGGPYDGSKPPVATTSMRNYIIEKGKVVYTDPMMCFGGDVTENLEGASESEVRTALEGKLKDLSAKGKEKFIRECILYFSMQKEEIQNNVIIDKEDSDIIVNKDKFSEQDIKKMLYFIHERMPSSLQGSKEEIVENVIKYLNYL